MKKIVEGVFKPNPTRTEAKGDTTTRVAREILDREENARILKTERLRAAREAQEERDGPKPEPVRKPARKAPVKAPVKATVKAPARATVKTSAKSPAAGPATSAAKGAAKNAGSPSETVRPQKTAARTARPKAGS